MEELDDFEPQDRPRSCTWPSLRRPDFLAKKSAPAAGEQPAQGAQQIPVPEDPNVAQAAPSPLIPPENKVDLTTPATQRKNGSRRNAWGNLSYADLITKAIQGAPEQRLTLAQIYEWMVKNVPFFKDKGDSNSSAGWKNSIRHNLSLHSRFVRVQNEGTGKSSWWMINPDAKPGKSSRRRSSSMDTNNAKWDKKRGRAKKKAEEKAKYANNSPKLEGGVDDPNALPFQLGDFRSRASSNASSCGRLSPIIATPDMHDREAPSMSPIPFIDHLEPPNGSHYDGQEASRTTELTNMAKAMSLNTGMVGSPMSHEQAAQQMDQLPVPSNYANSGASGQQHYHSGNGGNNGYSIYSPPSSTTYSGSELSPAPPSGVQSPYSSYSHSNTPVMSPMGQCSPINGVNDLSSAQYIQQQQQGLLSQSASVLAAAQETRLISDMMSQMMPSCREESMGAPHRSPTSLQRYLQQQQAAAVAAQQQQQQQHHQQQQPSPTNHTTLASVVGLSQQPRMVNAPMGGGHDLQAYQHHALPTMHHHSTTSSLQGQVVGGYCGSIPTDLDNLNMEHCSGLDFDVETYLRSDAEGYTNVNFDNINTSGAPPPASIGTNWVH